MLNCLKNRLSILLKLVNVRECQSMMISIFYAITDMMIAIACYEQAQHMLPLNSARN